MVWASGHTHAIEQTLAAFANAVSDHTLLITQADFESTAATALAAAFAASPIQAEVALDSAGAAKMAIDVVYVDAGSDAFVIRVGTYDMLTSADTLYWRYGSTEVSNTASNAYRSSWLAYLPLIQDFNDRTANGIDGTGSGGVAAGTGGSTPWGAPASTDFTLGTNQYISMGAGLIGGEANVTILAWSNPDSVASVLQHVISSYGSSNDEIAMGHNSGTGLVLANDGGVQVAFGGTYTNGTWKQHAVVYQGGVELRSYINGASVGVDSTIGTTLASTAGDLRIGNNNALDADFEGNIADAQIHLAALTAGWIANEYAQTSTTALHTSGAPTTLSPIDPRLYAPGTRSTYLVDEDAIDRGFFSGDTVGETQAGDLGDHAL